jgi:hypothetical protein
MVLHAEEEEEVRVMGRYVRSKMIGKDVQIQIAYYRDGYRIHPFRRKHGVWYEGGGYPLYKTLEEAVKDYNEIKTVKDVTMIAAGLRD